MSGMGAQGASLIRGLHIKDGCAASMADPETERLARAFCEPIEELWRYVQVSGHHPVGWTVTAVFPRVREVHALIVAVKGYLDVLRERPTTDEVREILRKLQEVAQAKTGVRNHLQPSTLTIKLMECGPPCQAYVAHTDPEHSKSLPWQNGLTRMQTPEERRGITGGHGLPPHAHIETLLCRMKTLA
jgi:hypothetical protein